MPTFIPTDVTQVDDRSGNHYEIYTVRHTNGTITDIAVPDGTVSAAILMDMVGSGATVTNLQQQLTEVEGISVLNRTSGASGLSFGDWAANDGFRQVTIDVDSPTGTYTVVVKITGSAGGTISTKQSSL